MKKLFNAKPTESLNIRRRFAWFPRLVYILGVTKYFPHSGSIFQESGLAGRRVWLLWAPFLLVYKTGDRIIGKRYLVFRDHQGTEYGFKNMHDAAVKLSHKKLYIGRGVPEVKR